LNSYCSYSPFERASIYQPCQPTGKEFSHDETAKQLAERIITFDPLGNPVEGGFQLNELRKHISGLNSLNCDDTFKTVLVNSDLVELYDISVGINKLIEAELNRKVQSEPKSYLFKESAYS
jgi:hypothetical protein